MLPCYVFQYLGRHRFSSERGCRSRALFFDDSWPSVAVRSITEVLFSHFGAQTLYFSIRGRFGETHLGPPCGTVNIQKAFPCSAGLVPFCAGAFPCSVALVFLFWGYRSMVQHGLNEGVKNIYKTNAILHIFKVKCTSGAATKWIPKSKICKKTFENK